jgi:cytochrome c peroxidase
VALGALAFGCTHFGAGAARLSAERVLGRVPVPAGNPQTQEKVELGKLLFFDKQLSAGNTRACASCHDPAKGWSDGVPRNVGPKGELDRNSPSLFNSAYEDFPAWDGFAASLEEHNAGAITFDNTLAASVPEMIKKLSDVPEYRDRFGKVFRDGVTLTNVIRALAAFERSVLTFNSPYDRFVAGERSALTKEQQEGLALFTGKAGCSSCHTPPLFADNGFHALGVPAAGPQKADPGRFAITGDERDRGAFHTPTLRNAALTAPYMHNGVLATLEEVVAFYDAGGGTAPDGRGREIGPFT